MSDSIMSSYEFEAKCIDLDCTANVNRGKTIWKVKLSYDLDRPLNYKTSFQALKTSLQISIPRYCVIYSFRSIWNCNNFYKNFEIDTDEFSI